MSVPRDSLPRLPLPDGPAVGTDGRLAVSPAAPAAPDAPALAAPAPAAPAPPISVGWVDEPSAAPISIPLGTSDVHPPSTETRVASPQARIRPPQSPRERREHQPAPPANTLADGGIGQVLGAYRLVERIGKGGMGVVYRAEHIRLGREVALKVLRADYAKRRDAVSRFFQEARTVNRIRHRNIVDVTDFVELPDGTTYIIMELLRGKTLAAWTRAGADAIGIPRTLSVLIQICDALAAAHAVGVVHRDLKPDNIIVVANPDGSELAKLLDFGVAKLLNRDDEDVGLETADGSVIGTPAYMSPEQAGGSAVDHRADIYSVGAIMYEIFCGQPLFRGRSFGEYVRKHLTESPVPPQETVGGTALDLRLESILLRCLEKSPEGRYPTATELRDDLLLVLASLETRGHDASAGPPIRTHAVLSHLKTPADEPANEPSDEINAEVTVTVPGSERITHRRASPEPAKHEDPQFEARRTEHTGKPLPTVAAAAADRAAAAQNPQPTAGPTAKRRWLLLGGGAATIALVALGSRAWRTSDINVAPPVEPGVSTNPTPPVDPRPAATPPAAPKRITIHIDALPGSTLYTDDSGDAVCNPPCDLTIDPADAGGAEQRRYIVRKEGFAEHRFAVDLVQPPVSVVVRLVSLTDSAPADAPHKRPRTAPTQPSSDSPTPAPAPKPTPAPAPRPQPPAAEPAPVPLSPLDPATTIDPFVSK